MVSECGVEIGDEVWGGFQPDGESDQALTAKAALDQDAGDSCVRPGRRETATPGSGRGRYTTHPNNPVRKTIVYRACAAVTRGAARL